MLRTFKDTPWLNLWLLYTGLYKAQAKPWVQSSTWLTGYHNWFIFFSRQKSGDFPWYGLLYWSQDTSPTGRPLQVDPILLSLLQRIPDKLEPVSPTHFTQSHSLKTVSATLREPLSSGDLLSALKEVSGNTFSHGGRWCCFESLALFVSTGPALILKSSTRNGSWESANLFPVRQTIEAKPFGYFSFLIFSVTWRYVRIGGSPSTSNSAHFPEMYRGELPFITCSSCINGEHWGPSAHNWVVYIHPGRRIQCSCEWPAQGWAISLVSGPPVEGTDGCFLPWGGKTPRYLPFCLSTGTAPEMCFPR